MVWSFFFFLLWFVYLIISSILLFTRGFLLTRDTLSFNSTCSQYSEQTCIHENIENCYQNDGIEEPPNSCSPNRGRVILIIIDALRYDFTLYNSSNKNPLPYQNNFPIIRKSLEETPENTRLYKFLADPPTTTMQRLKALTTGSLPTFIDAGSNFASYEIQEDNIIDQLVRNNLSVVFMGDDTWESLYPKRFKRSYPFPSFNVKDLDTVDTGVSQNLFEELDKTDWNLLIGHYLGVDHAGHRYGPNHSEMKRKLTEMNTVIENIIKNMDSDMVLYVLGDHGMTITGDHGGDTENEITSALFVHSKIPLVTHQNISATKQVNIVPTLATVLGVPIPFSNLGSIIFDSLPVVLENFQTPQWKYSLLSIWANLKQTVDYLRVYSKTSNVFHGEKFENIMKKYDVFEAELKQVNSGTFEQFQSDVIQLIAEIRSICEEVWIQFDSFSISRGLLLLFLSLFFVFIISDGIPLEYFIELFSSSFLKCSYIACLISLIFTSSLYYFNVISNLLGTIFFITGVVSQVMLGILIIQNWDTISLNWHKKSQHFGVVSTFSRSVFIFNIVGLFSNSFIEEEASTLLFLLTTFVFCNVLNFARCWKEKSNKLTKLKFWAFSIGILVLLRGSVNFWKCREEQGVCFSIVKEPTKLAWALALISLILFVVITKTWLKNCGSLNDYSLTVTLAKYAPIIMVILTGGYWALHKFRVGPRQKWNLDHLVWMIYVFFIFGIISTVIRPLLVFVLPRKSCELPEKNVIPNLFKKVKGLIEEKERKNDIPIIYGLGTVFSSVYVVFSVYFVILFGLLLGEIEAPPAVIMFLTSALVLIVVSIFRIEKAESLDELFEIPNILILFWMIISHYFFYGTGHQPAWSNIDWNAAFIGTSSNNFLQGSLVIINTFCPFILLGFLLPMLVITPFTLFLMTPGILRRNKELHKDIINQGELILFENNQKMFSSVFVICCKYLACHGIRVFASMLAATIHCRHLMVWKLFAPKFIFESVGIIVTSISVIFSFLILIRINHRLEKFITSLNNYYSSS